MSALPPDPTRPPPDRAARQVCLAEVGVSGQARIEAGTLALDLDLSPVAASIARRYAQGAGMLTETPGSSRVERPALAGFRHASSRAVAEGALVALSSILGALDS